MRAKLPRWVIKLLGGRLAPGSIRVSNAYPTTVATDLILNEPTYRLFRPDLENPTREDFEVATRLQKQAPCHCPGARRHLQL